MLLVMLVKVPPFSRSLIPAERRILMGLLYLISYRPGLLEDGYGGSRDSDPINMEVVRGTDDTRIPWSVDLLELTGRC